jgi:hypothetical protein
MRKIVFLNDNYSVSGCLKNIGYKTIEEGTKAITTFVCLQDILGVEFFLRPHVRYF